jgi:hypothetical protein
MPSLSQSLRSSSPEGYAAAVENPSGSPPAVDTQRTTGANPYIRCPLPPFNATVDTLRQFNENGKTPTRRVIPLPISTASGAGGTTNNNTTIIQQGGGSGTPTQATLNSASVTLNVPSLNPGQAFTATVVMAKSFQLLALNSSQGFEVRLYATAGTQSGDIVRTTDTAVPFEVVAGIITDVVFDTAPFVWNWQNRIAANADSPQTTNIYVTVLNPSQLAGVPAGQVSITYLPLES